MSYVEQVLTKEFRAEMKRTAAPHKIMFEPFDMGHEIGLGLETATGLRRAIQTNNGERVRAGLASLSVTETQAAFRDLLTEMLTFINAGYGGKSQRSS